MPSSTSNFKRILRLPHLFFLFSWTVPLALIASGLVAASRRLNFPGWGAAFIVLTGLGIGIGNPYTLFLFLQLLGWALVAQFCGQRRKACSRHRHTD